MPSPTPPDASLPASALRAHGRARLGGVALVLVVSACSSGLPSLGAVRIRTVVRTNDTFVAEGEVSYEASGGDLVKEITCAVFSADTVAAGTSARDANPVAGRQTFPVPPQPDGITNGRLDFALDGTGKEGPYEVTCGATSEAGRTSELDVRTRIVVP